MFFNDAGMGCFGKDHPQFFGTQCIAAIPAQPKRAKNGGA
jgi:hypothetical protein